MNAKEDPPSALKIREPYKHDIVVEEEHNENTKGSNTVDHEYDEQDQDLRTPCLPSPTSPRQPTVMWTAGCGWLSTETSSADLLPQSRERPRVIKRTRGVFAVLVHLLSALLTSLRRRDFFQLPAEERSQCQTPERLTMKRDNAHGACDPRLSRHGSSILGKRKNSFGHEERSLSETAEKRRLSRKSVKKVRLSRTVEKGRTSIVFYNGDLEKIRIITVVVVVHSPAHDADTMTNMLEGTEQETHDSRLKFLKEELRRFLDLKDSSESETSDCQLQFTKVKHGGFLDLFDNFKNESGDCNLKFTKEKRGKFLDVFNHFQPASVTGFVYPASGQPRSGPGGGQGHQPQLTPVGLSSADTQWPPHSMHGTPWTTFRQELYRLGTFLDLPQHFPVSPLRLAQAGFLRLANQSIVCYFCGLVRNEWLSHESPLEVHRQLSPDCPMVTGAQDSGNVAVGEVRSEAEAEDRLTEALRGWSLSTAGPTAQHGPSTPPGGTNADAGRLPGADTVLLSEDGALSPFPEAGAQASGYTPPAAAAATTPFAAPPPPPQQQQLRQQQQRQPPIRLGLMGGAPSSANPMTERSAILHGTARPQPPSGNHPGRATMGGPDAGQSVVTLQQLGIIAGNAKRPDMATVQSRVSTYRGGWVASHVPTPAQLAEAGFYYAGYGDCGRCFFCGGGLKNWEPSDDPWMAHALWFPTCAYVRQSQGQEFIDIVKELSDQNNEQPVTVSRVSEEMSRRLVNGSSAQEVFSDPAVASVVSVGFNRRDADAAARRMRDEGQPLSVVSLMDRLEADGVQPAAEAEDSESTLPGDANSSSQQTQRETEALKTENTALRQQGQCKVCLDEEVSIIFLPCGHLSTCTSCSPAIRNCPICRLNIRGRVRAFRPAY